MKELQKTIDYDLFITKQAENGAILEYSLYEQKHNISIDNLAHLTVTEDKDYCNYKVVNGELIELTEEEKQELIPTPQPSAEQRIAELEEQNTMLLESLLEMSAIVYA